MSTTNTHWDIWRDPATATEFRQRRRSIPGADAQMDVLHKLVERVAQVHNVLDLGCGDGVLLETILHAHPKAAGVGIDGSEDMLNAAGRRFDLLPTRRPVLIEADFESPVWLEALPTRRFDVIVSGFAIHHSTDDRKRTIYHEIHGLLRPGGVFVNIEHVASASPLGEALFERTYAEHQLSFRRDQGEDITLDTALHELQSCPAKAANKLAPVETQLAWLRESGFVDVDCYWKWFELAVIGGFKEV